MKFGLVRSRIKLLFTLGDLAFEVLKKVFSGHIEKYYSSRAEIILLALALFYMMMAAA